ncbi:MAG TPA: outer membrane beta-barrel protein [Phenylobacterium sp.]|uniref:outer membrane beta-barrel protein n=1 Tax=Phenylobacterium sp. TaxID=1871053 RepID=UPI002F939429
MSHRVTNSLGLRAALMVAAGASALLSAHGAKAQENPLFKRGENVGVLERPRPGYEALGIRTGSFVLYPKATFRVEYDSNVFAQTNAKPDTIYSVAPQLELQSDWGRHAASVRLEANLRRYGKHASEDADTWALSGKGRLDVSRRTTLDVRAGHAERVEARTMGAYAVDPAEPIQYRTDNVTVIGRQEFGRARLVATAEVAKFDYDDGSEPGGTVIDQDYRDRTEAEVSAKVAYAISPATAVFVEVGAQQMSYDETTPINRDSQGMTALAGVDWEVTRLITGEASVGYIHQEFDDSRYGEVSNPHYRLRLNWYPTPLVTVGLTATQRVTESPLADSPAFMARTVELKADYELLRNLIISGQILGTEQDYRGIDRNDRRYGAGLSANYLLNRTVGIGLRYKYETLESSGANRGRDFDDQSVSLALILQR